MDHAIAIAAGRSEKRHDVRKFALALLASLALPPVLLASFVIAVDPYYVFGSPSWRGFNAVRPTYESHVLMAKPYQVWRKQPAAVALGSSRVEVGIDPRHHGWASRNVFNFALPSSNSYAVMLAFLHAQSVAPLKQAVVGLDFFAFNIHFPVASDLTERRLAPGIVRGFAEFLDERRSSERKTASEAPPAAPPAVDAEDWNEALYLAANPDVAAAIARGEFKSGREHYERAGRAEGRLGAAVPEDWDEAIYLRLHPDVAAEIARGTFLNGYHHYLAAGRVEGRRGGMPPAGWNEKLYLAANPDVAAAVARKEFRSGREHYELAGRAEQRLGAAIPADWDEAGYLQVHPDVAAALQRREFVNGYHHYIAAGRKEGRQGGFLPANWNEALYLAANPEARARVALGQYRTGYLHYVIVGQKQGLLGGPASADLIEEWRARWPWLDQAVFRAGELGRLIFSVSAFNDALSTIRRQSEPAEFDDAGMRVWQDHEAMIRGLGGNGVPLYGRLSDGFWRPVLIPPKYAYCFTSDQTAHTTFEPYRYMLRKAYAGDIDMRLYVTPLQTAVRALIDALDLGSRYDFWLRELTRINESEAARAGRRPFPLWDFSDPNTITREAIPKPGDLAPMRWYWEYSHYRKETGDLILDRMFDHAEPTRTLPADFGVRLGSAVVDAHIARSNAQIAAWSAANSELVSRITHSVQTIRTYNRQAEATCW